MKNLTILLFRALNFSLSKAKQTVSVTIASFLLVSTTSFASPISQLYVLGDSLSDVGAFKHLAPQFCPPPPYSDCRFSNGPVWAEILAADLGLSSDSAYGGGTNYAIGGQRTDEVLNQQVPAFMGINGGVADANALYVIWAGGNDFFQDNPVGTFDPLVSANNILDVVSSLSLAGATDFLIPNLPVFDPWAFTFNAALENGLNGLGGGLNIIQLDLFSAFIDVTLNPGDYGFTNVTDPCFDGASVCADPDEYFLWDAVHPTTAGHQVIAATALAALQVSAPATIAIFSLGLVALVRIKRKRLI